MRLIFLRLRVFMCFFGVFFFVFMKMDADRRRRISFSSLPCNMTLLFIKNQNNLLYFYSKRHSKCIYVHVLYLVPQCRCVLLRFFFWRFCCFSSYFSKNYHVNLAVASTVPKFRRQFWSNKLTDGQTDGVVNTYNILGTTRMKSRIECLIVSE